MMTMVSVCVSVWRGSSDGKGAPLCPRLACSAHTCFVVLVLVRFKQASRAAKLAARFTT
jgi:hypothetical protein